jgi:hypothetical protein
MRVVPFVFCACLVVLAFARPAAAELWQVSKFGGPYSHTIDLRYSDPAFIDVMVPTPSPALFDAQFYTGHPYLVVDSPGQHDPDKKP